MHFFYLKNSVKNIDQKLKNTKNFQYLRNGWKHCENPQNFSLRRCFNVFYNERLLVPNNIDKKVFLLQIERYFLRKEK